MDAGIRPGDRRTEQGREKFLGVGQHEADEIAAAAARPRATRRRPAATPLEFGVRAASIAVAGDETIAGIGARALRQRVGQRA